MTDSAIQAADPATFRAQFPVFDRLSYLNAGTEGPVPARSAEAAHRRVDLETLQGRCGKPYFDGLMGLRDQVREAYAAVIGAPTADVALTGSTTDGVNTVISGLRPSRRGRDPDDRGGAPGLARPAWTSAVAARRDRARGAVRGDRQRGVVVDAARGLLARFLGQRADRRHRGAGGDRRAGAARRRPGDRRDPRRRRGARLRVLCRVGSEVAVRAGGQRLPVRARGAPRRPAGPVARLQLDRRSAARARVRAGGGRRAPGPRLSDRHPQRLDAGLAGGVRGGRLAVGPRARRVAGGLARRQARASAGSRCWSEAAPRWCRGSRPTPRPTCSGSPRRTWSCASSPRSASSAHRSARGPRRRSSSGSSAWPPRSARLPLEDPLRVRVDVHPPPPREPAQRQAAIIGQRDRQ